MKENNNLNDPQALLKEKAAADFLDMSVKTLQSRRQKGLDPRYIKLGGAIRYRVVDLLAWIENSTISPRG